MDPREVTIVGGGIGGLSLAIALRQHGIEASVLEQTPAIEPIGSGLTLGPHALRALDRLGVGPAVRERSGHARRRVNLTANGRVLRAQPWRGAAIHRAELQELLLEAAGGPDHVHLTSRVLGFRQSASKAFAMLEGGRVWHGAVLVGADGLHSRIRAQLFGDDQPRSAGMIGLRGVAPFPSRDLNDFTESWGRGRRFGLQPIGADRAYWYATSNRWFDDLGHPHGAKAWLLTAFGGWHPPIERVIQATRPEDILVAEVCDRAPLRRWAEGRVTLLGDAAHAMTPDLGTGAAEAMEDALVLASCLREHGAVEGLRAYEGRRVREANALIRRARRVTRIRQLEDPLLCGIRNLTVRLGARISIAGRRRGTANQEGSDEQRRQQDDDAQALRGGDQQPRRVESGRGVSSGRHR